MPAEITQTNDQVAEVRIVCDNCGQFIGTRLMPKKQADAKVKSKVICQNCREIATKLPKTR